MVEGPRYAQISSYFQTLITKGKLLEGEQIPTEGEICKMFQVSRITARQALDRLVQDGFIYKIQGKGSFVSAQKESLQLNHLIGFSDEMRMLGLEPSTTLLHSELVEADEEVAQMLQIKQGQNIYYWTRLRCANGKPMAVETLHLPELRFPAIEKDALTGSLYGLLKDSYACELAKASQSIQAGSATVKEAEQLHIKTGAPVLRITRITFEKSGMPFEYVKSVYRGDKYVFNVTLS